MKELISLTDYKMGRDKTYPLEWTPEVEANAIAYLKLLNAFLNDLGITEAKVSSGFRPAAINSATLNSAKKSLHMIGKACDIHDNKNQDLGKLVASRPDLLKKYGLWVESLQSTKGINSWVHIDCGTRSDRPSRAFLP